MGPLAAVGEPARRRLPLAAPAGAVRGLRRRHRPGDLRGVRLRAPPHCICGRGRAQRADARRDATGASSARTTRASSACGCGTATSSTPRSSTARTRRVIGKSFGQVGMDRGGLHPVDAFLDLVLEHGTRAALAHHDLQPPARGAQEAGPRPRCPDGLLRRRRAPAQHGVLQHGSAAAAPRPRRRARRARRS